ncbi:MAG: DNA primase, partial [Pseudomonadota bacterium]
MPRFTPEFLDELKARLRPSDVVGRYVKLKKQGNEFAGLSPFTKEKTPSFFVNDQKGFYHCFSSGKHGDVISFLQETQNVSFHEAVERLAEDAGMELPRETPQAAEQAKRQAGLAEACEAAAHFFEAMLARAPGRHAADYLRRRAVSAEQIKVFRIGYAPGKNAGGDRTALKDYLINKGFSEAVLVEAGLVIKPDDGGPAYDRFRDRVMFPILGARDRVIAFGGRALDPDARAKYLNSPETPLFHKSNVLYNLGPARAAAAADKAPIIVCE